MRRSPLCNLASLRTEAGVCLTCSSHTCSADRDIHPSQTRPDIRTVGPADSQNFRLYHRLISALESPGAIPITFFTVCKNITSQSLFSLEFFRFTHLTSWFRSCIVRCVHMSLIFRSLHYPCIVFLLSLSLSMSNAYCALFLVHCFHSSLHCSIVLYNRDIMMRWHNTYIPRIFHPYS
jgi:hypothetical protein